MQAWRRAALTAGVALALGAPLALRAAQAAVPAAVTAAVADPKRPDDDRKMDADRKPAEVVAFAGVKAGQTVAEYLPGGGYYTRILSDVVGPKGKIWALETTTWGPKNIDETKKAIAGLPNVTLDLAPLGEFSTPGKADVFWTTLNYHDLHIARYAKVDMAAFNKKVFDALKPGGIYFILDHQGAPGTTDEVTSKIHRIERDTVVREVTAAGFKLVAESDLLRHPADDHTKTVFDPSVRLKTDQFILKFKKPA
jgi:predicted methyltransferase